MHMVKSVLLGGHQSILFATKHIPSPPPNLRSKKRNLPAEDLYSTSLQRLSRFIKQQEYSRIQYKSSIITLPFLNPPHMSHFHKTCVFYQPGQAKRHAASKVYVYNIPWVPLPPHPPPPPTRTLCFIQSISEAEETSRQNQLNTIYTQTTAHQTDRYRRYAQCTEEEYRTVSRKIKSWSK